MKLLVFGLSVSSSWGNGHATLWRGLAAALARRGDSLVFLERDRPWYAAARDLTALPAPGQLILYSDWAEAVAAARPRLADADAVVVTSYCPDGVAATELVLTEARGRRLFYDLDTPVTLARLAAGEDLDYIGPRGLADFDLVLSYTGGWAPDLLRERLGARRVVPFYGHVDPEIHRPSRPAPQYRCDLSYIGTFAADRQEGLQRLFIDAARDRPAGRFCIAGALYPPDFPWADNIFFVRHLPPGEHPGFFAASRLTLNVTRTAMSAAGWCPSGRLFEAAACGCPVLTDGWEGLDRFFTPGEEILVACDTADTLAALDQDDRILRRIGEAARARVLADHTAAVRAEQLRALLSDPPAPRPSGA
ncbi:MAG: hypothetical protein RLY86_1339 [Pseudomonadota bacterium]|jgi:spore maturation protein CgeB